MIIKYLSITSDKIPPPHPTSSIVKPSRNLALPASVELIFLVARRPFFNKAILKTILLLWFPKIKTIYLINGSFICTGWLCFWIHIIKCPLLDLQVIVYYYYLCKELIRLCKVYANVILKRWLFIRASQLASYFQIWTCSFY